VTVRTLIVLTSLFSCATTSFAAVVDTIEIWNGGTGAWSTASRWSGGLVPNNGAPPGSTYSVQIDSKVGTVSTVAFSTTATINNLQVDKSDVLNMQAGSMLTLFDLSNAGIVNVGGASYSSTSLVFTDPTVTLAGGGMINLTNGVLSNGTPGQTLNNVDQTISGYGRISQFSLNNAGTILANVTAKNLALELNGGASLNSGIIRAIAGNIVVSGSAISNSGEIRADPGGSISIFNTQFSMLSGGRLNVNGGAISVAAPFILTPDNFLLSNGAANFGSFHTNGNSLSISTGSSFSATTLNNENTTVTSAGRLKLQSFDNQGGVLELTANGTSSISGSSAYFFETVNNAAGVISLRDTARLTFGGSVNVTGGVLKISDSAAVEASGQYSYMAPSFTDITLYGTLNLGNYVTMGGNIQNNGTLNIGYGMQFIGGKTLTLAGPGTINFGGDIEFLDYAAGNYLLINRGNTIRGKGAIFGVTNGLIKSDVENHGIIEATGFLTIGSSYGQLVNSPEGILRVASGGALGIGAGQLTSTGSIIVQSGGMFNFFGSGTIASIDNAGTVAIGRASVDVLKGGTIWAAGTQIRSIDVDTLRTQWPSITTLSSADAREAAARVKSLEFGSPTLLGGTLDITNRTCLVDYDSVSPYASLAERVAKAYHSNIGAWQVSVVIYDNITSSTAASEVGTAHPTGVAIAEASALFESFPVNYQGKSIDATTIILRYAYTGDLNLDGRVDRLDLQTFAERFGNSGGWTDGDFNYSGSVDSADLQLLRQNYGVGTGLTDAQGATAFQADIQLYPELATVVPEPSSLIWAVLSASVSCFRPRRKAARTPANFGGRRACAGRPG
jgi:hypothetical protein